MLTQKAETKTNRLSVENKCVFPGTGRSTFVDADGIARSGNFTFITNLAFPIIASSDFINNVGSGSHFDTFSRKYRHCSLMGYQPQEKEIMMTKMPLCCKRASFKIAAYIN